MPSGQAGPGFHDAGNSPERVVEPAILHAGSAPVGAPISVRVAGSIATRRAGVCPSPLSRARRLYATGAPPSAAETLGMVATPIASGIWDSEHAARSVRSSGG